MKIILFVSFAFWFLAPAKVFAGNDKGSADGVVCFAKEGNILSVELLDLFEARRSGLTVDLGTGSKISELATFALKRFEAIPGAPSFGVLLEKDVDTLLEKADFVSSLPQLHLHDAKFETLIPSHCRIRQLAIQTGAYDPLSGKITWKLQIEKKLWEKMDLKNKAGFVLHEFLLNPVSLGGLSPQQNQLFTLYTVVLLLSSETKNLSAETVSSYFEDLGTAVEKGRRFHVKSSPFPQIDELTYPE